MIYRNLTSPEKLEKLRKLTSTSEGRGLMEKPLLEIIEQNNVSKNEFIERLNKESKSINKYFKGYKGNGDKQNLSMRQHTLKSKLMIERTKKAIEEDDYSLTLNKLENITQYNAPTLLRAIDDLRPKTNNTKFDIISEFADLTDNSPNVKTNAKATTELELEIEKMSPEERTKDIKQLGDWTKRLLDNGLLDKNHIRSIYDRDEPQIDSSKQRT